MAPLIVDHTAIIERIIEIFKNNKTIYDSDNPKDKLRKIIFAESENGHKDDSTPYAWVTIPDRFQFTKEQYGTNQTDFSQNQVEYHIVIISQKRAITQTLQELFYFADLLVRELKANPKLTKPSDGTDPKVIRTNVISVNRYEPKLGQNLSALRIILGAQVGVTWQLSIPSASLTLDLISKPDDTFNVQDNFDREDDGQIENTPFDNPGKLDVEVEVNDADLDTLENLVDGFGKYTVLILKNGVSVKTRSVTFNSIRKPVPFDNIERAVVSMTVIP